MTDRRTDGGDCNIPNAFLKKRGDKNAYNLVQMVTTLRQCVMTKAPISLDCDCFATTGDRHREWLAK